MNSKTPHRNLMVWQKAMDFAVIVELTRNFPQEELYVLTSQLRSAAVSGSRNEINTQLELALRLGYVTATDYDRLYASARRVPCPNIRTEKVSEQKTVSSELFTSTTS